MIFRFRAALALISIKDADCDPVVGIGRSSRFDLGSPAMTVARQIVFHSVRHADLERQRPKHYQKDLPIIIVLIILFGALSVLLGLWQGPVPTLISAL